MDLPQVKDWMQPLRLVVAPDLDVREAIDQMVEAGVSVTPVVREDGKMIGLLTEKDCLRVLANSAYDNVIKAGAVEDYMSPLRVILRPTMDMFHAAQQFLQCHFPTLPVVDGDRIVGRLRRQDMLRCIQARLIEDANRYQEKVNRERAAQRPKSIQAMQETAAASSPKNLARRFTRNR
jgi:CBS domain-containing protein